MKTIFNGLIKENAVLVLLLGLCSALAITTKVENAFIMGVCVLLVLVFSNFVISLIRKIVPENVKIPVYILIIGTFVTIIEILLKKYTPALYDVLDIYLPLIIVNCIVLGRAMSVASKSKVGKSLLDAIGIGLGYMFVLIIIAFMRESLGSSTITLMDGLSPLTGYKIIYYLPETILFPMKILVEPAGAFLILGILVGLFNTVKEDKKDESH